MIRDAISKNIVIVFVFWRPTELTSLRTIQSLENVQKTTGNNILVVSVLSPKYSRERSIRSLVREGWLTSEDVPSLVLVDDDSEVWEVQ